MKLIARWIGMSYMICIIALVLIFTIQTNLGYVIQSLAGTAYIKDIQTTKIDPNLIRHNLKLLNDMSKVDIVKYEGSRPIIIKEVDEFVSRPSLAGQAHVKLLECTIYLKVGEADRPKTFFTLLVHEYLHCLGFGHVDNIADLMYPDYSLPAEENINKYVKELEELMK